ncbi:hypothetical protein [Nocardia aurantiaca]|uniref:hypothetical protein n=1 Tax=Nocardia aurantiaca TaxID=2675850 RepID=UPI0012B9EF0F|nr:hypothetical protein [Nocardia aurantiaca]
MAKGKFSILRFLWYCINGALMEYLYEIALDDSCYRALIRAEKKQVEEFLQLEKDIYKNGLLTQDAP